MPLPHLDPCTYPEAISSVRYKDELVAQHRGTAIPNSQLLELHEEARCVRHPCHEERVLFTLSPGVDSFSIEVEPFCSVLKSAKTQGSLLVAS